MDPPPSTQKWVLLPGFSDNWPVNSTKAEALQKPPFNMFYCPNLDTNVIGVLHKDRYLKLQYSIQREEFLVHTCYCQSPTFETDLMPLNCKKRYMNNVIYDVFLCKNEFNNLFEEYIFLWNTKSMRQVSIPELLVEPSTRRDAPNYMANITIGPMEFVFEKGPHLKKFELIGGEFVALPENPVQTITDPFREASIDERDADDPKEHMFQDFFETLPEFKSIYCKTNDVMLVCAKDPYTGTYTKFTASGPRLVKRDHCSCDACTGTVHMSDLQAKYAEYSRVFDAMIFYVWNTRTIASEHYMWNSGSRDLIQVAGPSLIYEPHKTSTRSILHQDRSGITFLKDPTFHIEDCSKMWRTGTGRMTVKTFTMQKIERDSEAQMRRREEEELRRRNGNEDERRDDSGTPSLGAEAMEGPEPVADNRQAPNQVPAVQNQRYGRRELVEYVEQRQAFNQMLRNERYGSQGPPMVQAQQCQAQIPGSFPQFPGCGPLPTNQAAYAQQRPAFNQSLGPQIPGYVPQGPPMGYTQQLQIPHPEPGPRNQGYGPQQHQSMVYADQRQDRMPAQFPGCGPLGQPMECVQQRQGPNILPIPQNPAPFAQSSSYGPQQGPPMQYSQERQALNPVPGPQYPGPPPTNQVDYAQQHQAPNQETVSLNQGYGPQPAKQNLYVPQLGPQYQPIEQAQRWEDPNPVQAAQNQGCALQQNEPMESAQRQAWNQGAENQVAVEQNQSHQAPNPQQRPAPNSVPISRNQEYTPQQSRSMESAMQCFLRTPSFFQQGSSTVDYNRICSLLSSESQGPPPKRPRLNFLTGQQVMEFFQEDMEDEVQEAAPRSEASGSEPQTPLADAADVTENGTSNAPPGDGPAASGATEESLPQGGTAPSAPAPDERSTSSVTLAKSTVVTECFVSEALQAPQGTSGVSTTVPTTAVATAVSTHAPTERPTQPEILGKKNLVVTECSAPGEAPQGTPMVATTVPTYAPAEESTSSAVLAKSTVVTECLVSEALQAPQGTSGVSTTVQTTAVTTAVSATASIVAVSAPTPTERSAILAKNAVVSESSVPRKEPQGTPAVPTAVSTCPPARAPTPSAALAKNPVASESPQATSSSQEPSIAPTTVSTPPRIPSASIPSVTPEVVITAPAKTSNARGPPVSEAQGATSAPVSKQQRISAAPKEGSMAKAATVLNQQGTLAAPKQDPPAGAQQTTAVEHQVTPIKAALPQACTTETTVIATKVSDVIPKVVPSESSAFRVVLPAVATSNLAPAAAAAQTASKQSTPVVDATGTEGPSTSCSRTTPVSQTIATTVAAPSIPATVRASGSGSKVVRFLL